MAWDAWDIWHFLNPRKKCRCRQGGNTELGICESVKPFSSTSSLLESGANSGSFCWRSDIFLEGKLIIVEVGIFVQVHTI